MQTITVFIIIFGFTTCLIVESVRGARDMKISTQQAGVAAIILALIWPLTISAYILRVLGYVVGRGGEMLSKYLSDSNILKYK